MFRILKSIPSIVLVFLVFLITCGLVWTNILFAESHPGEKEFFIPWLAARTFLNYGDNPYGTPATQRAQVVYYGRLANEGEDPLRLSIPFPIELFYFPFALITDYTIARGLWMTVLEIALVALAFISLRLTSWKPVRSLLPIVLIFSTLWVYGFLPLVGGRAVIFVAVSICGLLLAIREGRDELAGALLVIPFFKPDITGILVLFIFWWTVYNRRYRILAGFSMTIAFLLVISFFLLPDWFVPFLGGMVSHMNHNPGYSPGGILASIWPVVGLRASWALTAFLLVTLFFECREVRGKDFRHFLWTISLILAFTPLLGIPVIPQDYVPLFFPVILILSILSERWRRPNRWGMAGFALVGIFVIFWIISASLLLTGNIKTLANVLVLLLPVLLVIGLYWIRWWGIQPVGTMGDPIL